MAKALSLKQPFAWLVVNGYKPVENREWRTKHRGWTLIHASKNVDHEGYAWLKQNLPEIFLLVPKPEDIEKGGVVGIVQITDCVDHHLSIWFFGKYGFVIEEATPLPFYPSQGQVGLFNIDYGSKK